jgi:farnesyl-diphosphate farnesyltransferase
MGTGMVDLAHAPVGSGGVISLHSVADYERYGRCVAGLVFQGLTQFFSASGKEDPWTDSQMELSVSLALFLQKADIICDFHEDVKGDRYFWPKEIWGRAEYGGINDMRDMWEAAEKDEMGVMYALSAMTVNALLHATDALDYLTLLKNQSVFNFYGILATKGIATLELCFMNREVFKRNLKIRKVEVAKVSFYAFIFTSFVMTVLLQATHALDKPPRSLPDFL